MRQTLRCANFKKSDDDMLKKIGLFSAAIMIFLAAVECSVAQDPIKANPGKYRVIFENERVRLLEYKDKPGDVSTMHWHPDHLVYSLSAWTENSEAQMDPL